MATEQFSTSNVLDTALMSFFAGAGVIDTGYEDTFDFRFDTNVAAIRKAPWTLDTRLQDWDGKSDLPTAEADALDPQLMTYTIFGLQVILSPYEEEEIPTLVSDAYYQIGEGVAETAILTAAAAKAQGFTIPSVHGGKTLFSTTHATRDGTLRPNRISSGADRAAFNSMHATLETWPSFEGYKRNAAFGGTFLEYNPTAANRDLVNQVYRSQFTSGQMQANVLADEIPTFIKNPYLAEDKFIMGARSPGRRPFMGWIRKRWQMRPVTGENNEQRKINIHGALAFSDKGVCDNVVALSVT